VRRDEQEPLQEVGVLLVGVLVDAGEELDPGPGGDLDLDDAPLGSSSPATGNWRTT